jgi:hypothetical protein
MTDNHYLAKDSPDAFEGERAGTADGRPRQER